MHRCNQQTVTMDRSRVCPRSAGVLMVLPCKCIENRQSLWHITLGNQLAVMGVFWSCLWTRYACEDLFGTLCGDCVVWIRSSTSRRLLDHVPATARINSRGLEQRVRCQPLSARFTFAGIRSGPSDPMIAKISFKNMQPTTGVYPRRSHP